MTVPILLLFFSWFESMGDPDIKLMPWLLIFGTAAVLFVCFQNYLLGTTGQTVGKHVMRIRIVDRDSNTTGGFLMNVVLRYIVNGVLVAIPLYALVDILFIFSDRGRCLHDRIAGTIVLKVDDAQQSDLYTHKKHLAYLFAFITALPMATGAVTLVFLRLVSIS